jgi:hypothetical protein
LQFSWIGGGEELPFSEHKYIQKGGGTLNPKHGAKERGEIKERSA